MEIKVLKSFIAVATHLSFSKAAKELHTVQPAISRHITGLEDELGVKLFYRTSREVTVTAAGQRLLQDAMSLIEQTEKTKHAVTQASEGHIGRLTIGYLGGATLSFLPGLVRMYLESYPNVDVDLVEMTASEQIDALEKREIDISFSRPLPLSVEGDYTTSNVYTDKLVGVVSKTHPLAKKKKIMLSELKDEPFILFEREQAVGLFDSIITQCQRSGFSPSIKKQPNQMQTVLTQVASGIGVSVAPYAIKDLRSGECSFLSLQEVDVSMPLVMTHHRSTISPTARMFSEIVLDEIEVIRKHMT